MGSARPGAGPAGTLAACGRRVLRGELGALPPPGTWTFGRPPAPSPSSPSLRRSPRRVRLYREEEVPAAGGLLGTLESVNLHPEVLEVTCRRNITGMLLASSLTISAGASPSTSCGASARPCPRARPAGLGAAGPALWPLLEPLPVLSVLETRAAWTGRTCGAASRPRSPGGAAGAQEGGSKQARRLTCTPERAGAAEKWALTRKLGAAGLTRLDGRTRLPAPGRHRGGKETGKKKRLRPGQRRQAGLAAGAKSGTLLGLREPGLRPASCALLGEPAKGKKAWKVRMEDRAGAGTCELGTPSPGSPARSQPEAALGAPPPGLGTGGGGGVRRGVREPPSPDPGGWRGPGELRPLPESGGCGQRRGRTGDARGTAVQPPGSELPLGAAGERRRCPARRPPPPRHPSPEVTTRRSAVQGGARPLVGGPFQHPEPSRLVSPVPSSLPGPLGLTGSKCTRCRGSDFLNPQRQGCVEDGEVFRLEPASAVHTAGAAARASARKGGPLPPLTAALVLPCWPRGRLRPRLRGVSGPGAAQYDGGSREDPALKSVNPGRLSPGIPQVAAVGTRPRRARPRGVGFPARKAHRTGPNGDLLGDSGTYRLGAEPETQQQPEQLEDVPAQVARIPDMSRALTQLCSLVTDLEKTARGWAPTH
ncbi:tripartite motif-containing protein 40 [Hyaena hyaena]|uniref:tripartite motif-containing protein 40 n=1 Tax=Hyaena hyaena TaxID=95912 RepID=UPI0019236145|nr:tripartite motif-containing protein 40 [Hyaena hyaena]